MSLIATGAFTLAIKTLPLAGGVTDSATHQSQRPDHMPEGSTPALHAFLGSEPDTQAVAASLLTRKRAPANRVSG